jgi:MYXO-CTERM domain-containing protein
LLTSTGPTLYFQAHDGSGRGFFKLPGLAADTTPPRLTCPADVTAQSSGVGGAVVTYPPASVRDDSGSAPAVSASPASGTLFPMGASTVTVSATDASGNQGQCNFTVTVWALAEADAGTPDGGMVADGGAMFDGGSEADGGAVPDGGSAETDAGTTADAGTDAGAEGTDGGADAGQPGTDGGSGDGPKAPVVEESGCGCGSTGGPGFAFWGLAGLALLASRLRRSGKPGRS